MKVKITDLLDSFEDESVRLSAPGAQRTDHNPEEETIEVKQSRHRFGWKEGLAAAAAVAVLVLGGFGLGKVLNRETTPSATEGPDVSRTVTMDPGHTDVTWAEAAVYTLSSEERLAISRALTSSVKAEYGPTSFVLAPEEISFGTKGEDPVPEKLEPGMKIGLDFTVWIAGTDAVQEDQLPELFSLTREQAEAMQKQDGTPVLIATGTAELTCLEEGYSVESCRTSKVRPAPETMSGGEMDPELRRTANRFLTYFAEQGVTEITGEPYDMVSFAHLYYKINEPEAITYRELDGESYETLTKEQVDNLLQHLIVTTPPTVEDPTDFTEQRGDNYAQHEMYRDGIYWFPAADGDQHTQFAVVDQATNNQDGTWKLEYRVYDLAEPGELTAEQKDALAYLTVRQAESDEQFTITMCGAATVLFYTDDEPQIYLHYLHASWVDPASLESEELEPAVQTSVNSLLSRLAEQDVRDLNELKEDEGALMTFANHLAKSGRYGEFPFTAQSRDGKDYLTLKLSDLNGILSQVFLNTSVNPAEGTTFSCPISSDPGAQGFVKGGVVWFPSGEDVSYPNFVVCDGGHTAPYEVTWADGTIADAECLFVNFRVYEAGLEDHSLNADNYCKLTPAEAEALAAEKTVYLVEKGTAVILPAGGGQILDYRVSWVEPEGWEEEWPQEYPVTEYRIEGEGFLQSGEINMYRYEQLPEAEGYVDVLTGIAREALGVSDASFEIDSPHDGYANWFMRTSHGSASVSGSGITGRFSYNLNPGFDRILAASGTTITDRGAMEAAATQFVKQFEGITGPLVLAYSRVEEQAYHDERFIGMRDVIVPTMTFLFRSEENSRKTVKAQEGLTVPVTCGDSTLDDLSSHVFAVQVWPDGTVVSGDNYITRAEIAADGKMRMPGEDSMETILSFMTSLAENDVFVLESAGIEEYSVYFGHGEIDPILTVRYHFDSDPEDHQTTQIAIPGLLD